MIFVPPSARRQRQKTTVIGTRALSRACVSGTSRLGPRRSRSSSGTPPTTQARATTRPPMPFLARSHVKLRSSCAKSAAVSSLTGNSHLRQSAS
eukprot:1189246-Pyramimonas_sp.AAC.1